ncbi:MAG TPA: hypothetical protein VET65_07530 [Candidatus Limnocylindrales bacterium]|nr:hypothetical protein [Candidatus Limnocylindrales bacterium]
MASIPTPAADSVDPRAVRSRVGVLLLILSDGMLVAATLASHLYLNALNVMGQFRPAGEHAPSFAIETLLTAVVVGSAVAFWWGSRGLRSGDESVFNEFAWLAVGLVVIALVGQVWLIATLDFPSPLHGYASMTTLIAGYHGAHLVLTAIVGLLVMGRFTRGRLRGQAYIAEVTSYWWGYVAAVAVAIWLLGFVV